MPVEFALTSFPKSTQDILNQSHVPKRNSTRIDCPGTLAFGKSANGCCKRNMFLTMNNNT